MGVVDSKRLLLQTPSGGVTKRANGGKSRVPSYRGRLRWATEIPQVVWERGKGVHSFVHV